MTGEAPEMKIFVRYRFAAIAFMAFAAAFFMTTNHKNATKAAEAPANPLLAKWEGPYGGVPPFDKVKIADFKPALEAAMAENLKEIDAIANDPAKPTFANTFIPLEKSGDTLNRVNTIVGIWATSLNTGEFPAI